MRGRVISSKVLTCLSFSTIIYFEFFVSHIKSCERVEFMNPRTAQGTSNQKLEAETLVVQELCALKRPFAGPRRHIPVRQLNVLSLIIFNHHLLIKGQFKVCSCR